MDPEFARPAEIDSVLKRGWLEKKGEFIRSWRRRYFVLYIDGTFNGYREEPTAELIKNRTGPGGSAPENRFNVKDSSIICPDNSSFLIRCRQKEEANPSGGFIERHFHFSTKEDRDDWKEKIETLVESLIATSPAPMDVEKMETDQDDISNFVPANYIRRQYKIEDFVTLKTIGKGTFGNVVLVYRRDDPRQVRMALKVIDKRVIRQKEEEEHTRNERQVLAMNDHPFLIKLYHAFQSNTKLYFAMEFALGGEIYTHLAKEQKFPVTQSRFYGAEIVSALGYLHKKTIVYRDLKLENLLLDKDGHIKITDFGLCKILSHQGSTNTFCGTPEYLAPEVLEEPGGYSYSVDWWSLGVVLHEMIVGRLPFPRWEDQEDLYFQICHNPLPDLPLRVPSAAASMIRGLLQKVPHERLGGRHDAEELIHHPFFECIDFDALERKEIQPEFVPVTDAPDDVSHFDPDFTNLTPGRFVPPIGSVTVQTDPEFPSFDYNHHSLPDTG